MRHIKRFTGALALVVASGMAAAAAQTLSSVDHIVQTQSVSRLGGAWQASAYETVRQSVPPLPPAASDIGPAPANLRLERMLLLLSPSAAQQKALDAEISAQQDSSSSEYHQWLTPAAFADRFANSSTDVASVATWLTEQGFDVAPIPAGRGWLEFSGNVSRLEQTFRTEVHAYRVGDETRYALTTPIAVPAALQPVVQGLVSLDAVTAAPAFATPQPLAGVVKDVAAATTLSGAGAITPRLAAQWLHFDELQAAGQTGTGESVAIVSRGSVRVSDIAAFRTAFGLPEAEVKVTSNGPMPVRNGDEAGTALAASWTGVAAPGARIAIVSAATTAATDGIDLSLAAIVDGAISHTVEIGYSACEVAMSNTHKAFYAALYRQAAAQGMAIIAAAGDSGAAACHAAGDSASVTSGLAVNALASTPWNTAVGASAPADLAATSISGWAPVNAGDPGYAGGGGASHSYTVPAWQPLPSANLVPDLQPGHYARLIPDLALPTGQDSASARGVVFCYTGASSDSQACTLVRSGGSSAAAAMFAGVAAVVAQKYGPQGNLAPRLYALSRQAGVFDDVQQGNARLSCTAGSPDCDASGQIGYAAAVGYDLATGLGSINAQKLVASWARPDATGSGSSTVTLSVTPTVPNTTYNPTAQITLMANVVSGTGGATPTGTVTFADSTTGTTLGGAAATLNASGTASVTITSGLANGGNSIKAVYSGDATYASANSQVLVVTAEPSTTSLVVSPATTTPAAGATLAVSTTLTVGSPPAGTTAPSGKVTLNLDGLPTATATLNSGSSGSTATFSVTIPSAGVHTLQTVYAGDSNYNASTSPAVTVTATKGATVTSLTATPSTLTAGTAETFTATIAPVNAASGATYSITGTVSFYDGTTLLGTAVVNANSASLGNITLSSAVLHTITAVYSGDTSWAASTSNAITLQSVLLPDTVTLAVSTGTSGPGQSVSLTATVTPVGIPATNVEQNPTGNVIFYNGTTVLGTVALGASLNYSSAATLITGALPGGQNTLTAVYVGDLYYAPGTSNPVTIDVQDFTLTVAPTNPGTNLTIPKGSSGTASYVITGLGGFANQIQVVCAVPTQDDMTCQTSPQQVTPPATVAFTVQTYAAGGTTTTAASRRTPPVWPRAAGGTALAVLLIFVLPTGSAVRKRLTDAAGARVKRALVLALLVGVAGFAGSGCNSSTTVPQSTGTPLGVATLKITASAYIDNTVVSHSVFLTVNVVQPGSTGASVHTPFKPN